MFRRDGKKVLQIDLSSLSVEDADRIKAIIIESCQIASLMGYGVSIKKSFVHESD